MPFGLETNRKVSFAIIAMLAVLAVMACLVIAGVLLVLVPPTTQYAREVARRELTRNHLRQIGLALHNYASTNVLSPPSSPEVGTLEK